MSVHIHQENVMQDVSLSRLLTSGCAIGIVGVGFGRVQRLDRCLAACRGEAPETLSRKQSIYKALVAVI
jgi:hypothetical protein